MTDEQTPPTAPPSKEISTVSIVEEMKASYLDYAMSVIVSRALPDVRDGLKPVHRRILFAMKEGGYDANRRFRKSARIVGDVIGKYHPHGESAVYDSIVRMAQDFSMRLPLVDGQGNFGSMDGDPAAAMRYTEARMARAAHYLLEDIDKETVDFQPNYDGENMEPMVLPARFPNLLVNGAGGIAVGMATNIPPHNLGEVIDGCLAMIENPAITIEELVSQYIPGPDFPTGGIIVGRMGVHSAMHTGRGSVIMRGRTHIEEVRKDRFAIVITEIPYQVNKARLVESIAEAAHEKRIEGIVYPPRDESDRNGVRVVVEIKRDFQPEVVLNQLFRFTPLQTTFGVNSLALNGGRPETMTVHQMLEAFIAFREEVITRRTIYELGKARERAHILAGLAVAVANIDDIIALIRHAPDAATAKEQLMERAWPAEEVAPLIALIDDPGHKVAEDGTYKLSEDQAKAILDMRLHRLTGLERGKIGDDLRAICNQIAEYLEILHSREKLLDIMRSELTEVKERFATPRRTSMEEAEFEHDIEDLIQREDMVITVSTTGYIKRVPLSQYRAQRRGGKGRSGMATREEDAVSQVFVASTHAPVLFFSSRGIAYKLKVYRLPLGTPQSRGKAMVNLLPLEPGETISTIMPLPEDETTWGDLHVMFATQSGGVRRNLLSDFAEVRANGKIAMKLDDGDQLVRVRTCTEDQDILLSAKSGKCIRFSVADVRVFQSRSSTGVRGIRLSDGDMVIGMSVLEHRELDTDQRDAYLRYASAMRRGDEDIAKPDGMDDETLEKLAGEEEFVLTITENGYGKRSSAYEYRITNRGGQGIVSIETSERNGGVVAAFPVLDTDQLVMVTDGGQLIRCPVHDIRIAGRNTQGVTLFRVAEGEHVVSVSRLREGAEDADDADDAEGGEGEQDAGAPETAAIAKPGDALGDPDAGEGDVGGGNEDASGATDEE